MEYERELNYNKKNIYFIFVFVLITSNFKEYIVS